MKKVKIKPPKFRKPPKLRRKRSKNSRKGGMQPSSTTIYGGTVRVKDPGRDTTFYNYATAQGSFSNIVTNNNGDFVTPNNHAYRRSRVRFPSGHMALDVHQAWNRSDWWGFHNYYEGAWYGMRSYTPYVNSQESELCYGNSIRSATWNIAYSKFIKQLKDSSLNLAVDIAEMSKSVGMIEQRLKQVIDLARKVRRKAFHLSRVNPNDPNKTPWAVIGKTWLEYQYGWKPLLSSAYEILDHYHIKARRFRIKGSHKSEVTHYISRSNGISLVGISERKVSSRATICCDFTVNSSAINDLSRLTSLNPLAVGWELVPYSFVVDWFVDIGGYMDKFEAAFHAGLVFQRGWKNQTHRVDNLVRIGPQRVTHSGSRIMENFDLVKFTESLVDKNRVKLYSVPLPELPTFDPKLGAARIASGAALLLNILTKFNRRNRFDDRIQFDQWGAGWKYL